MIRFAKEVDQEDVTRASMRALVLSHLPCSYRGCTGMGLSSVLVVGDEGGTTKDKHSRPRSKLCSGCATVKYCCLEHQKADIMSHQAACIALAEEKSF